MHPHSIKWLETKVGKANESELREAQPERTRNKNSPKRAFK
jgi:hypothetical protein